MHGPDKEEKARHAPAGQAIVLVIATLGAGGAERVMTLLAGEWARRDNQVTLITFAAVSDDFYPLSDKVKRIGLNVLRPSRGPLDAIRNNFRRLALLRSTIIAARPNVIISFMDATNVLVLMATVGLQVPVIVSERIDPRYYPIAGGWSWLRRKVYLKAAAVVVQTMSVAEWAREFVQAERVHVIPNPVTPVELQITNYNLPAETIPRSPFVMAIGRLDPQKGFDLLLRAFTDLPEGFSSYSLLILGEGPDRLALERLATELGIIDRVVMPGRIKNVGSILAHANCFVMSSRFEGFPNALLEAMAVGLPVVSYSCPSGPSDIITHELNGLLVEPENIKGLSDAMARVLGSGELRRRLGDAARIEMSKFSLEQVTNRWEQLFNTER